MLRTLINPVGALGLPDPAGDLAKRIGLPDPVGSLVDRVAPDKKARQKAARASTSRRPDSLLSGGRTKGPSSLLNFGPQR